MEVLQAKDLTKIYGSGNNAVHAVDGVDLSVKKGEFVAIVGRMKQTKARGNVRAKTGSVTGVSSLAGYVKGADGHQLAFVIINQNVLKLSRARVFQDKVCDILSR